MKIKKTLAFIMVTALTVGTMAGCSQATLNYSKELSNMAKWEAVTSNVEGSFNVDALGTKEEVTFTASSYSLLSKNQAYVDVKINDTSGKIKIPEIKAYVDGNTTYINKSFFEGIYASNGQTIPEGLSKISEEYIGIDSASNGIGNDKVKELVTQPDAMVKLGKTLFGDSNIDIPFVQNGREYTINLDANQTVDLSAKAIKAAVNNLDNINNTFKLQLTPEMINEAKKSVNEENFEKGLNDTKTALAGSTITSKEVFADNNYNANINVNLQIKDLGKMFIVMKAESTKSEVKAITLPTSKIKLTMEELNKISVPTTVETTTSVEAK